MRRLLVVVLTMLVAQISLAQEDIPPLVGPVVYGQAFHLNGVFQDLGTGEVWEVDEQVHFNTENRQRWSPNGCFVIFAHENSKHHVLVDLRKRTVEELVLPLEPSLEIITIASWPFWSIDSRRLVYSVYDGANTKFVAFDLETDETEVLYIRQGYQHGGVAKIVDWPSEHIIHYEVYYSEFELDLETGEIVLLSGDPTINVPSYPPFHYQRQSPNDQAVAVLFNQSSAMNIRDVRFSFFNSEEIEALDQAIVERPGIEIFLVNSRETIRFDLEGQIPAAAAWSPDGRRLAILTWPGDNYETSHGAYIYDLETNALTPVDGLRPVRHTDPGEYGFFQPGWSTDGEWVTLYGLDQGWVAYNVSDGTMIQLAEPFQDTISMMRVAFSPVTHYEPGACD